MVGIGDAAAIGLLKSMRIGASGGIHDASGVIASTRSGPWVAAPALGVATAAGMSAVVTAMAASRTTAPVATRIHTRRRGLFGAA